MPRERRAIPAIDADGHLDPGRGPGSQRDLVDDESQVAGRIRPPQDTFSLQRDDDRVGAPGDRDDGHLAPEPADRRRGRVGGHEHRIDLDRVAFIHGLSGSVGRPGVEFRGSSRLPANGPGRRSPP